MPSEIIIYAIGIASAMLKEALFQLCACVCVRVRVCVYVY